MEYVEVKVKCDWCDGEGEKHHAHLQKFMECAECDGTGYKLEEIERK